MFQLYYRCNTHKVWILKIDLMFTNILNVATLSQLAFDHIRVKTESKASNSTANFFAQTQLHLMSTLLSSHSYQSGIQIYIWFPCAPCQKLSIQEILLEKKVKWHSFLFFFSILFIFSPWNCAH